jgi:hypothetical protein
VARRHDKSALDLVEEATYLLRSAPASAIAAYYIGTLPFALAFLFFWADMGRSPTAYEHSAPAALGIAVLFLWMSVWQSIFAQALRSMLTSTPPAPLRQLAFVQATLQPTKFVMIPVALLLTVPLGAVFAFYQNLMAVSYEDARGIRQPVAAAQRQAKLWQTQNWVVIGFLSMLAVAVFINIGVLLLLGPQLLKTLLGLETPLARSPLLVYNSTFLAITAALTYALVDPIVKAVYVLRCFYGESLATGEDLKAKLKAIAATVVAAIVIVALSGGAVLHAQQQPPPNASVQQMDRSIDEVLKRAEFSWRLPHPPKATQEKSWLTRVVGSALDTLNEWTDQFLRWLHERFRPNAQGNSSKQPLPRLQIWVYVLLGVAVLIFIVLFFQLFRRRTRAVSIAEAITVAQPDLASNDTMPDQLAPDEWLRTARECIARNELRLAVRAMYLASLAYLGGRSLIAIDRGKSNRDYSRELRRRARSKPEIMPIFSDTIDVFERSWYGMHDVDSELVARVEANLATMRACVEQ